MAAIDESGDFDEEEEEEAEKDQGQPRTETKTSKRSEKGRRGRKANTNHQKENLSSAKRGCDEPSTTTNNSCASNTRSKCRKSRSGRSIRNSTRLASLNDDEEENNENGNENNESAKQSAVRTRRQKHAKANTDESPGDCLSTGKQAAEQQQGAKKAMTNHNAMYLRKGEEIKLDERMANGDQLQYADLTDLNGQRQMNAMNGQQSAIDEQSDDKLNNGGLYGMSMQHSGATGNAAMHSMQQTNSGDGYSVANLNNESNLHFMQQMHGYSLASNQAANEHLNDHLSDHLNDLNGKPNGQHFGLTELNDKVGAFNCKGTAFMQGLSESQGNDAIMSAENTIDRPKESGVDENEYDDDLDEIQRASLILDDSSAMQHENNSVLYSLNGIANHALNKTTINAMQSGLQQSSNGNPNGGNPNGDQIYGQRTVASSSSCCPIGSMSTTANSLNSLNATQTSLHRTNAGMDKCETAPSTYTLCCSIQQPAPNQHAVYSGQCLDRSMDRSMDRSAMNGCTTTSASFTQSSNPLLASTCSSSSSTVTSLTSISPVQIHGACSKGSNGQPAMLQVLTSANSGTATIELLDASCGLTGQSNASLISYSPVHHSAISHLNNGKPNQLNSVYSNGVRDHHLANQNQLAGHPHLTSSPTGGNQMSANPQISLISTPNNGDHLYHSTLDPNTATICSPDCSDLLEQYQLEPINNLLNSSKKTSFDEQLENENNLNNMNATTNFSLEAEKDVVYLLSSNNQNVSFLF